MKVAVIDKEASKRKGYHQSILRMEAKHQSHDVHNCLDPVKRIPVTIVLSEGDPSAHVENSLDTVDLPFADISSKPYSVLSRVNHLELSQVLPGLSVYICISTSVCLRRDVLPNRRGKAIRRRQRIFTRDSLCLEMPDQLSSRQSVGHFAALDRRIEEELHFVRIM